MHKCDSHFAFHEQVENRSFMPLNSSNVSSNQPWEIRFMATNLNFQQKINLLNAERESRFINLTHSRSTKQFNE